MTTGLIDCPPPLTQFLDSPQNSMQ